MAKKSNSKYDKELLVGRLARMRIEGSSTLTIVRFLMDELGYSRNNAYEIIKEVQEWIMNHVSEDAKVAYGEAITRLEELYERGDAKVRLDVIKELNKLRGLYATEKVDITSGGNPIGEIKLVKIERNTNEDNVW